jgi:hypothetical protein
MRAPKTIKFPAEQSCPLCAGRFLQAESMPEYEPVVIVSCPHCAKLLWRAGLEETSTLVPFDPSADDSI